jgi:hypothetical protein
VTSVDQSPTYRPRALREPTRFYPPRWRLMLLTTTSLFFAFIGWAASRSDNGGVAGIGWTVLVLFGAAALVVLARALRPGPTLTIDAEGITDRTTLAPTGLVRWDEITVVRKREIGRGRGSERMLEVVLNDPAAFYRRSRSWSRQLADRYRVLLKHPDVSVPGSMVSVPMDKLIEELRSWRPDLQVLDLPPRHPRARLFGRRRYPTRQHPSPPRW